MKANKLCASFISGLLAWRCGKSLHAVRLRTPVWKTVRFTTTWDKATAWNSLRTAWTACECVFWTDVSVRVRYLYMDICTYLCFPVISSLQILLDVLLLVAQPEGPSELWGLEMPIRESPGRASWPAGPWWDPVRQHGGVIGGAGGRRGTWAQHSQWRVLTWAFEGLRIGGNGRDSSPGPLRHLSPAREPAPAQCRLGRKPESHRNNADFITPAIHSLNSCTKLWNEHCWGERRPRGQENNMVVTFKLNKRQ